MADRNLITVAPGVTREEHIHGYRLEGTQGALIAAGLARPEWFAKPGRRNKRGQVVHTMNFEHEGRKGQSRPSTKGRVWVDIEYTREEWERNVSRDNFEKALAEERKELNAMPATHEEFRRKTADMIVGMVEGSFEMLCKGNKYHGYRYGPEVIDELEILIQQMRNLLETGRTIYSPGTHQARVAEIKAMTASQNPELAAFLESVTKCGHDA